MTIFAAITGIVLLLAAAWLFGLFRKNAKDIGPALRQLLLDKSEGKITHDEFELQQAALHSQLLSPDATHEQDPKALSRALPVAMIGLGLLVFAVVGGQSSDEVKSGSSMAMVASGMGDKLSAKGSGPGLPPNGEAPKGGDLSMLVKGLADKMENDPNNGEGWLLLARTYGELRQYANAAKAYEHASALIPPDAQVFADWADAYVMANERQWDDKGRDIVKRAVKADPKNSKALSLAGSEAFDRKQYKVAIDFWKRQKAVEPADSMNGKLADSNIKEATDLLSGKKLAPLAEMAAPAVAAPGSVAGMLMLDGKLKEKSAPGDVVFLVVKAADGSNPPLAAKRYQVSELPVKFQFDDASAMIPGRTISKFSEVLVSARLSKSGEATAQPGDVLSNVVRTKSGVGDLKIELTTSK